MESAERRRVSYYYFLARNAAIREKAARWKKTAIRYAPREHGTGCLMHVARAGCVDVAETGTWGQLSSGLLGCRKISRGVS
ncbi:hypothetical protein GUJ93_ZPchr0010g7523 [Zizania palustris]|uniref:Uncharacterized protein n=1 Tax=Zizania palustris TaxID=103762 RepID=A0A8J5WDQ3_ZIZPA|nr:hypothetical protein GUJ93_ZPchr0010g7523 [Zizania palustris]